MPKMNLKIVLLFVVITMASIAFFIEKNEDQKEASSRTRFSIQTDQIQKISLTRNIANQSEILEFQRDSQGWNFKSTHSLADSNYINELTQQIGNAEFEEVRLSANASLDQFRFDHPAAQLTFTNNLGQSHNLIMSERRNFEGKAYFKIDQDQKIYTTDSDLDQKLMNKRIFFQDKHLFKKQNVDFRKIEIQSLNRKFEIFKISHLDQAKVSAFLSKIKKLTVQEYFDKPFTTQLSPPILTVVMTGEGLVWSLKLSLNPIDKKLYAEARIKEKEEKIYYVEYDTSYWADFANLTEQKFMKDMK